MEKQQRLAYIQGQISVTQMLAMYWHAMATTGAAKLRQISSGREPTPEEKEAGITLPMVELTDEEKVAQSLSTMKNHIHHMQELLDAYHEVAEGHEA